MCKSSVVTKTTKSKAGQVLGITTVGTSHNQIRYGAFVEVGSPPVGAATACLVCVPDGTMLTLLMPRQMQTVFDVRAREVVTMVDRSNIAEDYLELASGRQIMLKMLVGASVYVGVMEDLADHTDVTEDDKVPTGTGMPAQVRQLEIVGVD